MPQFDQPVQQDMEGTLEETIAKEENASVGDKFRQEAYQNMVGSEIEKGGKNSASLVCEFPILQPGVNVGQIDDNSIVVPPLRGYGFATGPGECHIESEPVRQLPPVDIPIPNRN